MPRIGFHHTEESRANRMSLAAKGRHNHYGELNPMFGKHHSEHTKALISNAHKGKSVNKGVKHPHLSEYNRTHIRRGADNPNYGNRILVGIPKPLEWRMRISQMRIEGGLSKGNKNPMSKEENIRKWLKSCNIKPNKAELKLNAILGEVVPNEYILNVDGAVIIGGKIPDFVNINGTKSLIELYGDFFHKGENPQDRIDLFKQYGYKTLVIWESQLEHPERVSERIAEFAGEKKSCH